jgi:signal transduction histidine kinase
MVSVQSPPERRELPYMGVLLLPAVLMAAATGAAVALVAQPARTAVGWCGAIATVLVVATAADAVRRARETRALRAEHARRTAQLEQRIAVHDDQITRLSEHHLPAALHLLKHGNDTPREVMIRLGESSPEFAALSAPQRRIVSTVLDIVEHEQTLRESAERSFVNIGRRVQAIVHQQAAELREMEEDHGRNPDVFDDLLRIDHGNAMIGRLADSISVLGGGRPGRQWPRPVALYSVLRGAMSRILEYRRINLASIAMVNVKGIAVEPVIHAAAELLDNATRYSPPNTKVHVTATEVQTGVCIEIEDSGVSLSEEARKRAEGVLERAKLGDDIQELGHSPRLGLAVVGRLCTAYKMQVSLRASAYGGVRAILVVPSDMLTDEPGVGLAHGIGATSVPQRTPGTLEGPKRSPKRRRPTNPRVPADVSRDDDVPEVTEWTEQGLPQRRSRVSVPAHEQLVAQAKRELAARRGEETASYRPQDGHETAPEPERRKDDTPPGVGFEAFWEGLKKDTPPGVHPTAFTRDPAAFAHLIKDPARTEADDEGDLT